MKILVAEDDFISRAMLCGVLRKSGHEVIEALHGAEAWEMLQQPDAPSLVILDWMMPEMDGPEVLRRVRAVHTDRPPYIIMLSARNEKSNIILGLGSGADEYLVKPFDPDELLARVEVGQRMVEMQLWLHRLRANSQRIRVENDQRMSELQDALTAKEEELRRAQTDAHILAARLQAVRESERALISRELHDALGQHLSAVQNDLIWMGSRLQASQATDLADARDKIAVMVPQVEHMTKQLQTICASLRSNVLFDLGLVGALRWQAQDTEKRTGLICSLSLPDGDIAWDQGFTLALFRIVQDALTNVVHHARATCVEIKLALSGSELELMIQDDGRGFPPALCVGSKTLGLLGMRERMAAFGGSVEFVNEPGKGATVRVRCPQKFA